MSDPVTQAEGLAQEVETDVKTFIENAAGDVIAALDTGYAWLKAELAKLEPTVVTELGQVITKVVTDAEEGESIGDMVADALDIIENAGSAALKQVGSDVITASVGLTTTAPSTPAG